MKRLLAALLLLPCLVLAQGYPVRAVRIVVPFPPGGGTDVIARIVAAKLSEGWQQPAIVENRAGASGTVGSDFVAKTAPDGYTLLLQGTQHAINLSLFKQLPYDTLRDFAAIAHVGSAPFLLVVHPSVPAGSVTELITYAKTKPGGLNYGSSGAGGAAHLAGEMFRSATGIQLTHIPYKGAAPAMADLIGGQIPILFDSIQASLPHVRAGRIKAIAITSARRSALAPEVPTAIESGLPGFEVAGWFGFYAPAATPRDIVTKLNADMNRVLALPDVKEKFATLGAEAQPMTTEQFSAYLRAEIARFAKAIKDSGATAE